MKYSYDTSATVKALVSHAGQMFMATSSNVYVLQDDIWVLMRIESNWLSSIIKDEEEENNALDKR